MLRWIIALSVLCTASAAIGFGKIVPAASPISSVSLAIFALSAVLLISAFDAFETQAVPSDQDDG